MLCPNKNLDSWKSLVEARGENVAFDLWDRYEGNVPESESKSILLQTEEVPASKSSPETLIKVKEVAKKMGIDIQTLLDYLKDNPGMDTKGINGLADLVKGVIAVAQGIEDVALTEEMVHVATAILEQSNSNMVTEMISKIDRFKIYNTTLEAYKGKKSYQLPNGKPDIRKIKKEAVDKLIAELIINQSEGSTQFPELMDEANRSMIRVWWEKIMDIIRGIYRKTNIDIFNLAGEKVIGGNVEVKKDKKGDVITIYHSSRNNENPLLNFKEGESLYTTRDRGSYDEYGKTFRYNIKENTIIKSIDNFDGQFGIDLDAHDRSSKGMHPYPLSEKETIPIRETGVDILIDDWGEYVILNSNSIVDITSEGNVSDIKNNNQIYLQNESGRISNEDQENTEPGIRNSLSLEGVVIPKSFTILWKESTDKSAKRINLWGTGDNVSDRGMDRATTESDKLLHSPTYQQIKGKSLREISLDDRFLGKELGGMDRNTFYQRVLSLRIIQSLYGNQFNRRLADRLGVDRITFVDEPNGNPMYTTNSNGLHININENKGFLKSISELSSPLNEGVYIDMAVAEELIHMVSFKLTSSEEQHLAYLELSQLDKNNIKRAYYNKEDVSSYKDLPENQYVHEYVRMKVQDRLFKGKTTENIKDHLNSIIDRVWNFIKDLIPYYKNLSGIYNKSLKFIETGEGDLNTSSEGILGLPQSRNPISFDQIEKVSNMILNKLMIKSRPFSKHNRKDIKDEYWYNSDSGIANTTAKEMLKDIVGNVFDIFYGKSVSEVIDNVKDILNQDLVSKWREQLQRSKDWVSSDSLDDKLAAKRLLKDVLNKGLDRLEEYSKENQQIIKSYLPSLFKENKYTSKSQGLYLANQIAQKRLAKEIVRETNMRMLYNVRKKALIGKYETLINLAEVDPDYKQRIEDKIVNEINRRIEFQKSEYAKNPNISDVLKFRKLYGNADFMNEQFDLQNKVQNGEISKKIDSLFDNMNYEAETNEYIAESYTVEFLKRIISQNSKYSDLAKRLLPFAEKHNINIELINKISEGVAGKNEVSLGHGVNKKGEPYSYITGERILIDYTSLAYQVDPERLILHELVHSLTIIYLKSEKYKNEQEGKKNPMSVYMEYVKKMTRDQRDVIRSGSYFFGDISSPYGFSNEDEFVTEALTNPFFIEMLKNIPAMETTKFNNLFEEILNWIAKIFNIGTHNNAYEQLSDIIEGIMSHQNEMNLYAEIPTEVDEFVSLQAQINPGKNNSISDAQKDIQKRIAETKQILRKKEIKQGDIDPIFMDTEDASNWYETLVNGKWEKVKKRVTDLVKAWYAHKFPGRIFTSEEKVFYEYLRTLGVKGHKFFEEIHSRYFDNEDGTRRVTVNPRSQKLEVLDENIYNQLENYYVNLIASFSKEGKNPLVFSEVMIYDPVEKEAGTIDLMIVEDSGKVNILDWKFMRTSANAKDVTWYKQEAYNIQLGRYKDILIKRYGVKKIGMNRAIPILMEFRHENPAIKDSKEILKGIVVGSVNPNEIIDLRLMPVSEHTEATSEERLDELIVQLNAIHRQIGKPIATTDEQRELKSARLNVIKEAIRVLQATENIAPLVNVIEELRKEGDMILNDYKTIYEGIPVGEFNDKDRQLSDFSDRIREYMAVAEIFGEVPFKIGDLIYNSDFEAKAKTKAQKEEVTMRKELLAGIEKEAKLIKLSREQIDKVSGKFADKFIGQRNLVTGLLNPKAVIKGLSAMFSGITELASPALLTLYKVVENAKSAAAQVAIGEVDELLVIKGKLEKRGGSLRNIVHQIYQKDDKDKIVNKLIYKYEKGFYDTIDKNARDSVPNMKILLDSIDVDAYKEESGKHLTERISYIKKKYSSDQTIMNRLIEDEQRKWDITNSHFNGWNNYIIKRHPLEEWYSKEYIELRKDPELLELYDFISKINKKADEAGYLQNIASSIFLPFVRKSMAEGLVWGVNSSSVKNWYRSLSVRADDVGYGSVNELTHELEYAIPKYYTTDFTKKEDGTYDTSDLSEELFKNMIEYINHMEKYKYISDVEGQLQLLRTIEEFKGHLNTGKTGHVVFDTNGRPKEEPGNTENLTIFDQFFRVLLYEQKYTISDSDIPLEIGKVKNFVAGAINNIVGKEVFTINENPTSTSLVKAMDAANRWFQVKTLGLEFISGAVNSFGNNIQIATLAGNYFKAREVLANEGKLLGNKFKHDDEREMFIQLVNKFMPLKEDPTYEKLKEAGMTVLTRHNFSDMLMTFMRDPEEHFEKAVFLTLLQNTMVENGRIVSIREFVKNKYKDRNSSAEVYRKTSPKIEEEIEELKKTRSIDATKKLEDGKLVIPGLDLNNIREMQRLTNLTRSISRNATGALSNSDLNRASMNIWTKSMMVFKFWIPKLVATRFSEFKKVADDFSVVIDDEGHTTGEKYDIGRIRLWFYVLSTSIRDKSSHITNILSLNDKGLKALDMLYEEFAENYKLKTGEDMTMTKDEFIDLVRTNLRNQVKELAMLMSLFGAMLALGFMAPADDDDRASKNFFRWSQKVVNKFITELSFFYNPVEFQRILSGGMFPAIGVFTDIERFLTHFAMQITGYDLSDTKLTAEEVRKKAQPIKYLAKGLPVTKSVITYISLFDTDFAKEFDITVQKQSGPR